MSKRIIYYFSGTGNSLYIAKKLSRALNCPLSPMSVDQDEVDQDEADIVGLVFPVYYAGSHSGIPNIVRHFVSTHQGFSGKYVFAVCTSGYSAGDTMANLSRLIKKSGGMLAAGYVVNMSQKSLGTELRNKFEKPNEVSSSKLDRASSATTDINTLVNQIATTARRYQTVELEKRSLFQKLITTPLRLLMKPVFLSRHRTLAQRKDLTFNKLTPYTDNSFETTDQCIGCGICAKVCPVNNIRIIDGTPQWQHHCETCLACYQWCPQNAITGDIVKYNERYHHPEISLEDMISEE